MTKIQGILNLSTDSFSDGGLYTGFDEAVAHAESLIADGADAIDIGAVSSNPDGHGLTAEAEISRLQPVVEALQGRGMAVSLDTFAPEVQRWGLQAGVSMINDIRGFPSPEIRETLAEASCDLVVMHAVQTGRADRRTTDADAIEDQVHRFFDGRLEALVRAGVSHRRLIVDPGMGFFLSDHPEPSVRMLQGIERLRDHTGCPVLVSVSRKSFLGALIGAMHPMERRSAGLAAELFAATHGATWIRTHEPRPLREALQVWTALAASS